MKRQQYKRSYIVEGIVDRKFDKKSKDFLYEVKWQGYPSSQNTWEPLNHLENIIPMVNKFNLHYDKMNGEKLRQLLLIKLNDFIEQFSKQTEDIKEIILSDLEKDSNDPPELQEEKIPITSSHRLTQGFFWQQSIYTSEMDINY